MFCDLASKVPVIMMHQLKSIYNSPCKDSHSHSIHTCFSMIASNASHPDIYGFLPIHYIIVHMIVHFL